jgi:hypothetical protein
MSFLSFVACLETNREVVGDHVLLVSLSWFTRLRFGRRIVASCLHNSQLSIPVDEDRLNPVRNVLLHT